MGASAQDNGIGSTLREEPVVQLQPGDRLFLQVERAQNYVVCDLQEPGQIGLDAVQRLQGAAAGFALGVGGRFSDESGGGTPAIPGGRVQLGGPTRSNGPAVGRFGRLTSSQLISISLHSGWARSRLSRATRWG